MRFIFSVLIILTGNFSFSQQSPTPPTPADTQAVHRPFHQVSPDPSPHVRDLIIPAALISYGFVSMEHNQLKQLNLSTRTELQEDHSHFKTHIDNYLQYTPALAVYALNIFGVEGKNSLRDRSMILGLSMVISTALVFPLKNITHEQRPDHSSYNSFPSGHTTTAFACAEFMRQEYKDVSPWYGIAGYAAAAATGVLRVYNNKHWVGDVVAGAGFGILSTKLSYWVYPVIKKKLFKEKTVSTLFLPYYQKDGAGLAMVYHFHN